MTKKIVFSGIQPSGNLHLGNYLGAVRRWVKSQEDGLNIYCIVDLHAITVKQEPKVLKEKSLELAALLVAAGINPEKSILFIQSHNSDHANLAWILNCITSMGQMRRMTQFKEKSEKKDFVSVGLFDYPVLMAADILLYDTTEVPVGEDQKQHVELARDLAQRFNSIYGETFVLPKPVIPDVGGRVMSLTEPVKKMSKSDPNPNARIELLDNKEEINKKILRAVTDSEAKIYYDPDKKPGVSNLLEIYSLVTGVSLKKSEERFKNLSYKEFKNEVSQMIIDELLPLQKRYQFLRGSEELTKVLKEGARKAREISSKKLREVYNKVGFIAEGGENG